MILAVVEELFDINRVRPGERPFLLVGKFTSRHVLQRFIPIAVFLHLQHDVDHLIERQGFSRAGSPLQVSIQRQSRHPQSLLLSFRQRQRLVVGLVDHRSDDVNVVGIEDFQVVVAVRRQINEPLLVELLCERLGVDVHGKVVVEHRRDEFVQRATCDAVEVHVAELQIERLVVHAILSEAQHELLAGVARLPGIHVLVVGAIDDQLLFEHHRVQQLPVVEFGDRIVVDPHEHRVVVKSVDDVRVLRLLLPLPRQALHVLLALYFFLRVPALIPQIVLPQELVITFPRRLRGKLQNVFPVLRFHSVQIRRFPPILSQHLEDDEIIISRSNITKIIKLTSISSSKTFSFFSRSKSSKFE